MAYRAKANTAMGHGQQGSCTVYPSDQSMVINLAFDFRCFEMYKLMHLHLGRGRDLHPPFKNPHSSSNVMLILYASSKQADQEVASPLHIRQLTALKVLPSMSEDSCAYNGTRLSLSLSLSDALSQVLATIFLGTLEMIPLYSELQWNPS